MRSFALFLCFLCFTVSVSATNNLYTLFWKIDLNNEVSKKKYPFNELSEHIYNSIQDKKNIFYTDSACKHKLNKDDFTQSLYAKNESVAGYTVIKVQEEWKFTSEGIISKVVFFAYENPNLPDNDTYKNLYIPKNLISSILKEITISGYYQGRAKVPLSEWIKKHDFEYTILKMPKDLPKPPYRFQYDKQIDDTSYKSLQILFDFFPEKNRVFNHTYRRNKNIEQNFLYLQEYKNESKSELFRSLLLEAVEKNKLIRQSADIEEVLGTTTAANYIFYFDAIHTKSRIEWTNIRVYLSSGKSSTIAPVLCAVIRKNKIKSIENYIKKNSGYNFTEYFTIVKIDFMVSYINNSYAKDVEEGLMLRAYLFGF